MKDANTNAMRASKVQDAFWKLSIPISSSATPDDFNGCPLADWDAGRRISRVDTRVTVQIVFDLDSAKDQR